MRNHSQGSTFSSSKRAPAAANTSPSPVASMTTSARIAKRPGLALHGDADHPRAVARWARSPRRAAAGGRRSSRPSRSARSASPPDRRRPSSERGAGPIPRPAPSGGTPRPAPDPAIPIRSAGGAKAPPRRVMRSTISWQRPAITCWPAPSSSVSSRTIEPAGGEAAERAVALDQHRVGAGARRRDRRRRAGAAAADDQHLRARRDPASGAPARRRSRSSPRPRASPRVFRLRCRAAEVGNDVLREQRRAAQRRARATCRRCGRRR